MTFVRIASVDEVDDGEILAVRVEGMPVCLARVGDRFYAFADRCSHRDFPLSSGELDADECSITCDWHGARFDIRTGDPLSLPATRPIPVYSCRVEDGAVYADLG